MFCCAGALFFAALPARAQEEGPIAPPPKYEIKTLSTQPQPGPPPIPLPQMIQQVAAHEDAIEKAYLGYQFQQETRITETSGGANKPGEYTITGIVYRKPEGERYEKIVKPPVSTLQHTAFALTDIEQLASLPLFILTSKELPNYNVTYAGDEKLDELHTYMLRVQPKQLDRKVKRFDGVLWVDDHDMAVVKSYGRFVNDVSSDPSIQDPFKDFEIYRENISGQLWFPTYINSDEDIAMKGGTLHLKLVMRSTNFQAAPGAVTSLAAPDAKDGAAPVPQKP